MMMDLWVIGGWLEYQRGPQDFDRAAPVAGDFFVAFAAEPYGETARKCTCLPRRSPSARPRDHRLNAAFPDDWKIRGSSNEPGCSAGTIPQ